MTIRCHEWISYSHWGAFRMALFTCPDWYAFGIYEEVDDDLLDEVPAR